MYKLDFPTFPSLISARHPAKQITYSYQSPVVCASTPTLIKTPVGFLPTRYIPEQSLPMGQLFSYPLNHQATFEKTLKNLN